MLVLFASSSNAKTKGLFTPWKFGSNIRFKFGFWDNNSGFDRYFFQLLILLKLDFNCCNNFALSWVDEVTAETWSSVSVIGNVAPWFATLV